MSSQYKMKWWGWGAEGTRFPLESVPGALPYLRRKLGLEALAPRREFRLEEVQLPESRLPPPVLAELAAVVGESGCFTDRKERVLHAFGKSYKDLLRVRSLRIAQAPDVVLYPSRVEEVVALLKACQRHRIAIVPFGGGTSVVSGVEPERGAHPYLAALDLTRLNRILEVDTTSQTAVVEAGIFGPELEMKLREKGYVLGHYPQSFEFSTLGGWIAARSSGQNSLRYGGIEEIVQSVRVITLAGEIATLPVPRRADGPDTKQILVGSEGILGIIVAATVRLHRAPVEKDYFMLLFKTFREASAACRGLVHKGISPAMVRVSDEEETEGQLAMAETPATGVRKRLKRWLTLRYLESKGFRPPVLSAVLIGLEGTRAENRALYREVRRYFARHDCLMVGRAPGRRWLETRFFLPYLRDELLDNALIVDTLETATTWSNLDRLYEAVRRGILDEAKKQGEPMVVYTHISHLYPDGASLYFSLLGKQRKADPLGQWQAIKRAANDAILATQGVISHHHGIGMDHKGHLSWSPPERAMVEQVKKALDPDGLLNPGKLL